MERLNKDNISIARIYLEGSVFNKNNTNLICLIKELWVDYKKELLQYCNKFGFDWFVFGILYIVLAILFVIPGWIFYNLRKFYVLNYIKRKGLRDYCNKVVMKKTKNSPF